MYAREHDNKVTIRCNAPSPLGLNQFWKEVQEYMDKGYRFDSESRKPFLEAPVGTTFTRVTLVKEEANTDSTIDPSDEEEVITISIPDEKLKATVEYEELSNSSEVGEGKVVVVEPTTTKVEETKVATKVTTKKATPKKTTAKKPAATK